MSTATVTTDPPTEKTTTEVPEVNLPIVVLLRTPGYGDRTRDALRAEMHRRGRYVTTWRQDAWYLQRGGARVVLIDLHRVNGLDSDPITVGEVRARCGEPAYEDDPDFQPNELILMTGSDEYPRPERYDPEVLNNGGGLGAAVLDVDKVAGYVDMALKKPWCKNRDGRLARG